MSIWKDEVRRLAGTDLIPHTPRPPGLNKRGLLLSKTAHENVHAEEGTLLSMLGRQQIVKAELDRWVEGKLVYDGIGRENGFLIQLDPPPEEIWELRITCPRPQIRLLCRFLTPDLIIGLNFETRDKLGEYGSPEWLAAMNKCEKDWDALFPNVRPFVGKTIHEYVTEKCDDIRLHHERPPKKKKGSPRGKKRR
ncbi:MAG: hypothetical protein ACOH2N_14955 [Devosia sp.]